MQWQQLVGMQVEGRYRLVQFLDAGGFGGVYLADEVVGDTIMRSIAFKLLRPPLQNRFGQPPTPEQRDALLDLQLVQLQRSLRLEHPHLLRNYSVGICELPSPAPAGLAGELLYIVMELGDATLAEVLRRGPLLPQAVLSMAQHLAAALCYLHEAQRNPLGQVLVHADIKPANILQVPSQRGGHRWKLADLGNIQTESGSAAPQGLQLGTIEYAAPEQFAGRAGPAADIWALGVVVAEALSARLPFGLPGGTTGAEQMQASILNDAPRLPEHCPAPLAELLAACLVKEPAARPTAAAVAQLLQQPLSMPASVVLPPAMLPASDTTAATQPPPPARPTPPADSEAEAQLRQAIRRALEDEMLSPYERSELNELRKRLDIRLERAASIFREEQAGGKLAAGQTLAADALASSSPPNIRAATPQQPATLVPQLGLAAPVPAAAAIEFIVDADSSRHAPYRSIAAALAAAPSGSRIQIRPGLYHESLVLDKPVELLGYGSGSQVLLHSPHQHAIVVNSDGVRLTRLQVKAGVKFAGNTEDVAVSALVVARGRCETESCRFECESENCIAVFGASSLLVMKNCEVAGGRGVGVSTTHDARVAMEGCSLGAAGLAAASCSNGGHLRMSKCRVSRCREYGVLVYVDGVASLRECSVTLCGSDGVAIKSNGRAEIERCEITDNQGAGVLVQAGCRAAIRNCNLRRNARRAIAAQRGANLTSEGISE